MTILGENLWQDDLDTADTLIEGPQVVLASDSADKLTQAANK